MKEKKAKPKEEISVAKLGAPSSCNSAKAGEARPTVEEKQRVWFGGGGKGPKFSIPPRPLLGICFAGKVSLPKIGRR